MIKNKTIILLLSLGIIYLQVIRCASGEIDDAEKSHAMGPMKAGGSSFPTNTNENESILGGADPTVADQQITLSGKVSLALEAASDFDYTNYAIQVVTHEEGVTDPKIVVFSLTADGGFSLIGMEINKPINLYMMQAAESITEPPTSSNNNNQTSSFSNNDNQSNSNNQNASLVAYEDDDGWNIIGMVRLQLDQLQFASSATFYFNGGTYSQNTLYLNQILGTANIKLQEGALNSSLLSEVSADEDKFSIKANSCNEVLDFLTMSSAEQKTLGASCPSELPHINLTELENFQGELFYGAGIWRSQAAFDICGSTEGLDHSELNLKRAFGKENGKNLMLPIKYDQSLFPNFTALSLSESTATKIHDALLADLKAMNPPATVCGSETDCSFASYQTEHCNSLSELHCAIAYSQYLQTKLVEGSGLDNHCYPQVLVKKTGDDLTFGLIQPAGSLSQPLNKLGTSLIEKRGNRKFLSSQVSLDFHYLNPSNASLTHCQLVENFELGWDTLDTNGFMLTNRYLYNIRTSGNTLSSEQQSACAAGQSSIKNSQVMTTWEHYLIMESP